MTVSDPTPRTSAHPDSRPNWVPIRSLAARHRDEIARHLVSLEAQDRYLRFGHAATDEQIAAYVAGLDFDRDELFGIFSRRLELVAMAHLAHGTPAEVLPDPPETVTGKASEFGVSVLARARRRGFGRHLFEHAMLHARNRGIATLFIHALSENTAMLAMARQAGARVVRAGPDSEAFLELPPDSLGSHVDEMVSEQAAEWNYRIKQRLRRRTPGEAIPRASAATDGEIAIEGSDGSATDDNPH